ncbi:hypothetical protein B0H34DRAFT_792782 [Crassisporium funariophilum]|nr:hypothetical protein B0H34DRAFT_792782 [Crassisporium funariophilum]
MARVAPQSLDFLRSSPVRGQLEAPDPRTPKGCRYIQTTDTPDELKVLLPAGTASMYEQLLKLENYELTKKPSVSWERIMEIRHLKDRMVRKCQQLAKTTLPMSKKATRSDGFAFQTFVAPADFRVKEMERWFRDQQKRATPVARRPSASGYSSAHEIPNSTVSYRQLPSSSQKTMHRSVTNPEQSSKQKQTILYKSMPTIQPSRLLQIERTPSVAAGAVAGPSSLAGLMSPPPLPVLLLAHREEYGLEPPDQPRNLEATDLTTEPTPAEGSTSPPRQSDNPLESSSSSRPPLQRKSSCIKRNSLGDIKTVTWADDNQDWDNQISKYASAARDAQASGKWDEVRVLYLEQIAGLESLQIQVKEGLEQLRSETDHLQRIGDTIQRQREALDTTFQDFEHKQTLFQEKVQEALTEATDALTRNGVKRELPPIDES